MSLFDPHNPYEDYPLSMADHVDRDRIPEPIRKQFLPACAVREREGSYVGADFSPDAVLDMRFGYGASIAFADQEIGKVLAALDECGIANDTLVIFMSDHGDSLGDHGLMVKGVALYEPVINVPLILRWPSRIPAGRCATGLAQAHDVARTCYAAAGLDLPRDGPFDTGESLLALAEGTAHRRVAVTAYRNSGISRDNAYWDPPMMATSVRGPWEKLISYTSGNAVEYEFFDLATDPLEQFNRFGDPDCLEKTLTLYQELVGWLHKESGYAAARAG
jgi:arylsulfatase A-like enzyme